MSGSPSAYRRTDLAYLTGATLILLLGTVPLARMLVSAWNADGAARRGVIGLSSATGVNIDVFVVFPVGLFVGWLLLFATDRSKKSQAVLLGLGSIPFVLAVRTQGAWSGEVSWIPYSPWLLAGVAVGLLTAFGASWPVTDRHVREFPGAVALIFLSSLLAVGLGFYDAHVARTTTVVAAAGDAGVSVLFLGLLGVFVQYEDRNDVIILTPSTDRRAGVSLLGSMYHLVENRGEFSVVGDRQLNRVRSQLQAGEVVEPPSGDVELGYRPPGIFSRWTSIRLPAYSVGRDDTLVTRGVRALRNRRGGRRFSSALAATLPVFGTSGIESDLARARKIIVVVPLDDPKIRASIETRDFSDRHTSYLAGFADLSRAARDGGVDVVTVTMDTEVALEAYEDSETRSVDLDETSSQEYRNFTHELAKWLGELAAEDSGDRTQTSRDRSTESSNRFESKILPVGSDSADGERDYSGELLDNSEAVLQWVKP